MSLRRTEDFWTSHFKSQSNKRAKEKLLALAQKGNGLIDMVSPSVARTISKTRSAVKRKRKTLGGGRKKKKRKVGKKKIKRKGRGKKGQFKKANRRKKTSKKRRKK